MHQKTKSVHRNVRKALFLTFFILPTISMRGKMKATVLAFTQTQKKIAANKYAATHQ